MQRELRFLFLSSLFVAATGSSINPIAAESHQYYCINEDEDEDEETKLYCRNLLSVMTTRQGGDYVDILIIGRSRNHYNALITL